MPGLVGTAVTNAAVDALRADATLTTLLGGTSTVYAHVPEDTPPPYVIVMAGREAPFATAFAEDAGRRAEVLATVVSAYRGTKQLDEVCDQVATTLLTDATWSGVSGYLAREFVEADRPVVEESEGRAWYSRRVVVAVLVSTS